MCVILRPQSSVFLIRTAARTSEGRSEAIKLIDSIHLGRQNTVTV